MSEDSTEDKIPFDSIDKHLSSKEKASLIVSRRGIRQKDLAETIGVEPSTLSGVLSGDRKSKKVKKKIQDEFEKEFSE